MLSYAPFNCYMSDGDEVSDGLYPHGYCRGPPKAAKSIELYAVI